MYGPTLPISQEIHATKYRSEGETFIQAMERIARTLADNDEHHVELLRILLDMRFMPAGRVQAAIGSPKAVTPYNCFVSGTIPDSMEGIMGRATEAAQTMRLGGGIGYDFSTIRPRGTLIKSLDSKASGPISFMGIFDAVCKTIQSAGHRRGAQMGVLRVDHPDIEEFISAKANDTSLTAFNISVGVTDEFMLAVLQDKSFDLRWDGKVYKTIRAVDLWNKIMEMTWDWAEPGVLFIDTINRMNNLWYCETIAATNPCAEQPLPPYGACLLGSFNLVKYIRLGHNSGVRFFDWHAFERDIPLVVRAMDNVVDRAVYPLPQQREEAVSKRRMGLGVTGLANAAEALGYVYGSQEFTDFADLLLGTLTNEAYRASAKLAAEKGPFPLFEADYLEGPFIKDLDEDVQALIHAHGIRNSHLTSIAPTGTISLSADNVSSGIEPVFSYGYDRTIQTFDGPIVERVDDYGVRVFGVKGKTANECSIADHVSTLLVASRWMDSAVSKTCNVGDRVTFQEFKEVYVKAWLGGAKGCTTFRAAGKRYGILNVVEEAPDDETQDQHHEPMACFFDPETGKKTCE
jgi:ribonucleoside-diphosphate reductase alpha chain